MEYKMEKILIISDIHGNYEAIKSVLDKAEKIGYDRIVLLGDIIDYGQRSNEVIEILKQYEEKIIVNIWGNHERSICLDEYDRFSTERGITCAKHTKLLLNESSKSYINSLNKTGIEEFRLGKYNCLAVHGSLNDNYWKSIFPDNTEGDYVKYDYVFSGHSHIPHCFSKYYTVNDKTHRNKKKTVFINPGSVGQPRNLNCNAAFAILQLDTGEVFLNNCEYDIEKEQRYFDMSIDLFYKERLSMGV